MTGIIAQNVGRTSGLIKAASGGGGGVWTLIKTLTASADSDLSFVDGTDDVTLDSTYPIYRFSFINMHPASSTELQFQTSIDGGSNYNVTLTSAHFYAYQTEAAAAGLTYYTGGDQAQGTSFQRISRVHNDNDSSTSGFLTLFNPSSTTFVKHFISNFNAENETYSQNLYTAGYFNTTSAIDAVQFKMGADEIDSGKIKLYGLKDSA
jgi:hypothetical protein